MSAARITTVPCTSVLVRSANRGEPLRRVATHAATRKRGTGIAWSGQARQHQQLEENFMTNKIARRHLLLGAGAALVAGALPGCATTRGRGASRSTLPGYLPTMDRIIGITGARALSARPAHGWRSRRSVRRTCCTATGTGRSGWSLSWGSGEVASALALGTGEKDIGVVGCGAIGLTTAVPAATRWREGDDLRPRPAAQCALRHGHRRVVAGFAHRHGRIADARVQAAMAIHGADFVAHVPEPLGLPGAPVEFVDMYGLRDSPPRPAPQHRANALMASPASPSWSASSFRRLARVRWRWIRTPRPSRRATCVVAAS